MTKVRALLLMLLIGTLAGAASAMDMDVEIGWGGAYRNLRWSPIFITAADPKPRTIVVELYVPHDTLHSMTIRQVLTIGPIPTTVVLYAPLGGRLDEASVTLSDPRSRRTLAKWINDPNYGLTTRNVVDPVYQLIGISGRSGSKRLIEGHFDPQMAAVKSVEMNRLPTVARGYESFSALMLDQPDLTRLSLEQQHAMVDWVRSGGQLVLWLGEDQLPATSPILQQLPATPGENTSITISPGALEEAGLPARFGNMKGRVLTPTADASSIPLFGGEVKAFKRTLGLGAIVLVPFDCSTLLISDQKKATEFWKPILEGAVDLTKRDEDSRMGNYSGYNDPGQQRRSEAARVLMNRLGDVPGAGSFGFSWVALVMVCLMLVVGPIDWIVLKRLGRQPWTWITTSGWIALVTTGAIYLGHILKSGELHYHTARLIDQAGDSTVAVIDTVGIYSPRTTQYELSTNPEGWWEPLSADTYFYRTGLRTDIDFHQDYRGNTPQPMSINVWNLRFLTSDTIGSGPPVLEANLRLERREAGQGFLVGTIKNLSAAPLSEIVMRCSIGYCATGATIAPGATLEIDERVIGAPLPTTRYGPYGSYMDTTPQGMEQYFRLAIERTSRIDRLLSARSEVVVVYAASPDATAAATLQPTPTVQRHQQLVRAVFPLRKESK